MALNTGTYKLNNGVDMPKFGLGTWLSDKGLVQKAVEAAIDAGYRHIDCAHVYGNEHEVGAAIANKIAAGVVKREDLFITSKLWNIYHRPEHVEMNLEMTLKDLQLEYLDLYLIHWPTAFKLHDDKNNFPAAADGSGNIDFDNDDAAHYANTFNKMLEIKNSTKKLRAIGVSNFRIEQLEILKAKCDYTPDVNQVESHPFNTSEALVKYCNDRNILITAYSPMGSPGRPAAIRAADEEPVMEHPVVVEMAKKYNKTAAQVLIKFAMARGFVVIPKSTTPSRIVENANVFDFELAEEDVKALLGLNRNYAYVLAKRFGGSRYYPFHAEYKE